NFAAQISLSQFAGQVAAAQVPAAAVTQYTALILANAALTGVPTAPTAAAGATGSQVATVGFVNRGSSLAATGWRENPDGSFEQWGFSAPGTVTFPTPFPTACTSFVATAVAGGAVQ